MNSKERLLKCIRHEPIDRVPISAYGLVGWNENARENKAPTYKKLMDVIRRETDCMYMSDPEIIYIRDEEIFKNEEWIKGISTYKKSTFKTRYGDLTSLKRTDKGVYTTWAIEYPLKNLSDIKSYLSLPYSQPIVKMEKFEIEKTKLGEKGLMMISIDDPACEAANLFGMSNFLMFLLTEPDEMQNFLDFIHFRQMEVLKLILKNNVKDVIFRICGPEYLTPPYFSPENFYRFCTKYIMESCDLIKLAGGIPRIHCHGKIREVLDQFAMTCAEMLDPVEPIPDGDIDLGEVKSKYGEKFCLLGNIELRELELADKRRIDSLVKESMIQAKGNSGYIYMPTATPIIDPLPAKIEENYLQMIESAINYGKY